MKRAKKYLFLSIKKEYVNRIFEGKKQIELRKSRPNVTAGDCIIIYCTSPIKAIVGLATILDIISENPERMWQLYSKRLGISRSDYFRYYNNSSKAIGIILGEVQKLDDHICLSLIKQQIPTFTPPQTYKYFMNFVPPEQEMDFILEPQ